MSLVIETMEGTRTTYQTRKKDFIKFTKTLVEWVFADEELKTQLIESVNETWGEIGNGLVDR